jgi:NADH dehydrogenase
MKVLVTGGTGVVGKASVDRLLAAGHRVRLLSRHAEDDVRQWPEGVEPHTGDVTSDDGVRGAAEECDAVLHVVGIVAESPPAVTFQAVNVDGTRRMAREAKRAGVRRFVYVSSLGANGGESDYHRSKLAGEEVVREEDPPGWLIVRPGNVYGPGDEVISTLLKMVRTMPAIPLVGMGEPALPAGVARGPGRGAGPRRHRPRAGAPGAGPGRPRGHQHARDPGAAGGAHDMHPGAPSRPELLTRLGARAAETMGSSFPSRKTRSPCSSRGT